MIKDTPIRAEEKIDRKIKHWYFNLMIFSNIFAMVLLGIFTYWGIFPLKVLEFERTNFKVLTKQVKPDGVLKYESYICKYADVTATVTRSFINGVIFSTPSFESNRKPGCSKEVISVKVPPELEPGKYYLRNTYVYRLNPIRTVTFIHQSEMFEIIN